MKTLLLLAIIGFTNAPIEPAFLNVTALGIQNSPAIILLETTVIGPERFRVEGKWVTMRGGRSWPARNIIYICPGMYDYKKKWFVFKKSHEQAMKWVYKKCGKEEYK